MGDRWMPLAVIVGALSVALAGVGVGVAITHDDDEGGQAVPASRLTTTTVMADTTTSTMPAPTSTTTSPPTTAARRTTTTPATPTTVRRTTTTRGTVTTVAGRPLCAAEQIDIGVSLDTSYPPGQPVRMETTLRNKSSTSCFYRGYSVTMTFLDPDGRTLVGQGVHADDLADREFAPGQAITHDATWDPRVCQAPPCTQPPGVYEVTAEWSFSGGRYGARQEFLVRAP